MSDYDLLQSDIFNDLTAVIGDLSQELQEAQKRLEVLEIALELAIKNRGFVMYGQDAKGYIEQAEQHINIGVNIL